jgi:putative ABC transport system substrate-binding protein
MERRRFVALAGSVLALPGRSFAQRMYRLGAIGMGDREGSLQSLEPFLRVLAGSGFVAGKNLELDLRIAKGEHDLSQTAASLVQARPDVIFAPSPAIALAARKATASIPIVAVLGTDPVALGLAASYAAPGGNVTGVALLAIETGHKRLEILKEAFPATRRVRYLTQKDALRFAEEAKPQAAKLGMAIDPYSFETVADLQAFFARPLEHDESIHVGTSALTYIYRDQIVALANSSRARIIYPFIECAQAGGLIAYAGDLRYAMTRAMHLVAQILKGANPATLAFEQVTRISLAINVKTARALGIAIPQPLLLRADQVID